MLKQSRKLVVTIKAYNWLVIYYNFFLILSLSLFLSLSLSSIYLNIYFIYPSIYLSIYLSIHLPLTDKMANS